MKFLVILIISLLATLQNTQTIFSEAAALPTTEDESLTQKSSTTTAAPEIITTTTTEASSIQIITTALKAGEDKLKSPKSDLGGDSVITPTTTKTQEQSNSDLPQQTPTPNKESSAVKKFFERVQCTLEKASTWMVEVEKEAKKLEATAKRFSVTLIGRFSDVVDTIIGNEHTKKGSAANNNNKESSTEAPTTTPPKVLIESTTSAVEEVAVVAESSTTAAVPIAPIVDPLDNEISNNVEYDQLCPIGFATNSDGICERLKF